MFKFIDKLIQYFTISVSTFGQVPVLEVNGKHLAQTHTICRHLAHKFNIAGKNDWEKAKCDEIVDGVQDFQQRKFFFLPLNF